MDVDQTDELEQISLPVRRMVANASDEQLAWIIGPDEKFYSKEALLAARLELDRRAKNQSPKSFGFNIGAMAAGPLWYVYHGMIGRGVLLILFYIGALYGLKPVISAVGIPFSFWIATVLVVMGAYCGKFAERDLAESSIQKRFVSSQIKPRSESQQQEARNEQHKRGPAHMDG